MYNIVHGVVAILKELDIITEEAYHKLCRELSTKIWPGNTEEALQIVQEAIAKVEKEIGTSIKNEPWSYQANNSSTVISKLTKDIETLNKKVEKLTAKKA